MTKQPEALRLINNRKNAHLISWQANACAELRRLHEVNQELLHWLRYIQVQTHIGHIHDTCSAAIAKGETT